mgnify:CR=1 FL=1
MQFCIENHSSDNVACEAEVCIEFALRFVVRSDDLFIWVQDLVKKSPHAATLDRPLKQACEGVRLNAALLKRDAKKLNEYLA